MQHNVRTYVCTYMYHKSCQLWHPWLVHSAEHCWMRENCWTATARRWGICQRRWASCCSPLASEGTIQGRKLAKDRAGSGATGRRYVHTYNIFHAMCPVVPIYVYEAGASQLAVA